MVVFTIEWGWKVVDRRKGENMRCLGETWGWGHSASLENGFLTKGKE
jgi:hypothetical protein